MSLIELDFTALNKLILYLAEDGYTVTGPVLKDGVVYLEQISDLSRHPAGVMDIQNPGAYSTKNTGNNRLFGFTHGPDSWKKFLYPSEKVVFTSSTVDGKLKFQKEEIKITKYVFFGVRSCELSAIKIHDEVFTKGSFSDPDYTELRNDNFIIAVNCTVSSDTCFCASMHTGPEVESSYDILLTEFMNGDQPVIVGKSGTEAGKNYLDRLSLVRASDSRMKMCEKAVEAVRISQKRKIDIHSIRNLIKTNINSNLFEVISEKCISCSNCTMACPTCFCYTMEDETDLTGDKAIRIRKWDSCFRENFSEIHGGKIRGSRKSRYRQWIGHKLSNWFDQFGSSGCVGCGRCITWCPAGIDITESANAFTEKSAK